jgi:ParB family chromosome partitioning protein
LSPDIQQAIRAGAISAGHGRAIISVEDENNQQELFNKIIKEGLNVRQAEKAASEFKNPKKLLQKKKNFQIILEKCKNHFRMC